MKAVSTVATRAAGEERGKRKRQRTSSHGDAKKRLQHELRVAEVDLQLAQDELTDPYQMNICRNAHARRPNKTSAPNPLVCMVRNRPGRLHWRPGSMTVIMHLIEEL